MKLISWNVNGLRAVMQKGFMETFEALDADVFCLQETKLQEGQISLDLPGYEQYWNYAQRKGYSGTCVFTRVHPLSVRLGIDLRRRMEQRPDLQSDPPMMDEAEQMDSEGRVITLEFEDFFFVTVYTPNSGEGLKRLPLRMIWEDMFLDFLKELERSKPVVFCGDLNVAHEEIDLKNPKTNRKNAGFTDEERAKCSAMLQAGFIDTWRWFYPDREGVYSWWSYRFKAREKNAGWRIDYFCVSEKLKDRLEKADIHTDVFGSDHCPVELCIR